MRKEKVNRAIALPGSDDRVVLFSWSTNPEPRQRNVARVDRHGNVVWRAELPGDATSDCFVHLAQDGDHFVARTYAGWILAVGADGQMRGVARESTIA